jgi:benzaldehyde dehydrogenase (NAD)
VRSRHRGAVRASLTIFGGVSASGNGARFGGDANLNEFTRWRWITELEEPATYPF